MTRRSDSSTRM